MKHAFLIIAHNEFSLLKELTKLLDHEDNDIYIHIDKKVKNINTQMIYDVVKYSKIFIFSEVSVFWGDESQIQCEMFLLNKARALSYDYYHIMSGVDLPLKTMNDIHAFFEVNRGLEFIHFDSKEISKKNKERVLYSHYLGKILKKSSNKVFRKLMFLLDDLLVCIQKIFKKEKDIDYAIIQKGCNWCSITQDFVDLLFKEEQKIRCLVKNSICGDEIFIQTVCVNSEFKNKLYYNAFDDNYIACMRYIVWDENNRKSPKTITNEDFEKLKKSDCLFARKFSLEKERIFTLQWINYLKNYT